MPRLNPFVALFLAIAAMNIGLFGWQRADMSDLETRIETRFDRIEAGQTELRERVVRIEARFTALEERFAALETRFDRFGAGQAELRERMARIEGTVAGALIHLAQAPSDETAN